ncbi:FAD/NAD-binding domain-containing protein [Phellopilus nigrolimitatus]|nr:FAD/NAD-binding domain-containing protein [Phellopilus nigrolimitatus]
MSSKIQPNLGKPNDLPPGVGGKEAGLPQSFKLSSSCIDDDRPFKVVVIGAGFSGITAGIRFPQRMKNLDLTIYEKNSGVGGTWFSNRYPGVACDVPSHVTQWSSFYAPGPEIRAYLQRVVDKYNLMRYIKLQHELTHARYDEESGKWHLKIRRPVQGREAADEQFEVIEDIADLVITAIGSLSRWSWPDIEGLKTFKGKIVHSADWETDELGHWQSSVANWGDKKVGVIGVGSTTTQIVPALQPLVKHLYNYVRGKAWLSPPVFSDKMLELLNREVGTGNYSFTEEDKEAMKDPAFFKNYRHELESFLNSLHFLTIKGSEMQKTVQETFRTYMRSSLTKRPWIADYLVPDFSVTCRRLTPGPGYLDALCKDNVDFVPTHIKKITETGIELVDGVHHDLDVIVCATGFDTSHQYPFPVIGRGGKTLVDRFTPHPETYLSLCSDGFPNWFIAGGPNSIIGTGTLLAIFERQVDYIVEAAKKLQKEHLKSIEPKKEAVADFDEYLDHYFKTTVFSEQCHSWYKLGKADGRVIGLWPGSSLHAIETFKRPRWEDYNYERLDGIENRFHWLGDGSTHNEKYMTGDRAWYLAPDEVDIPPVPEA